MEVTLRVADSLDAAGVPDSVGGSLASSFSGEPRASIDANIVVQLTPDQIDRSSATSAPSSMPIRTRSRAPSIMPAPPI
jgi:hypothetical protein